MTASEYAPFGRELIEGLSPALRRDRLGALENNLAERLRSNPLWDDYWQEVHRIIGDLKSVGHDLWSHDYDGERRWLWGWDYGQSKGAGSLQIQFDFEGPVRTFWRNENALLGTTEVNEDAEQE